MSDKLTYIPAPAKPEGFDEKVKQIGGTVAGGRPRYRFVWGMDETEFFARRERIKYVSINPTERGLPRWIAERWIPPAMFNPREWREYESVLGDYPSNGLYIIMFVHTDDDGGYAQLNDAALARLRHDHFYLVNQRLEAQKFAEQAEARERLRLKQEAKLEEETREGWVEYFSREDYYNAQRDYSFAARIMNPAGNLNKGETRTAGGIILPAGVSVK